MINVIVIGIILIMLIGAITYIVREKKRGVKCIGCPAAGTCSGFGKKDAEHPDHSCGCPPHAE